MTEYFIQAFVYLVGTALDSKALWAMGVHPEWAQRMTTAFTESEAAHAEPPTPEGRQV